MGSGLVRWLSRLLAAAIIAGALAYIPYRVYGSNGYVHYRKLTREQHAMAEKNRALAAENARMERQIRRLKSDPEAIAAVARDELGLVAPGEIVIQIDRSLTTPSKLEPDPAPPGEVAP